MEGSTLSFSKRTMDLETDIVLRQSSLETFLPEEDDSLPEILLAFVDFLVGCGYSEELVKMYINYCPKTYFVYPINEKELNNGE